MGKVPTMAQLYIPGNWTETSHLSHMLNLGVTGCLAFILLGLINCVSVKMTSLGSARWFKWEKIMANPLMTLVLNLFFLALLSSAREEILWLSTAQLYTESIHFLVGTCRWLFISIQLASSYTDIFYAPVFALPSILQCCKNSYVVFVFRMNPFVFNNVLPSCQYRIDSVSDDTLIFTLEFTNWRRLPPTIEKMLSTRASSSSWALQQHIGKKVQF